MLLLNTLLYKILEAYVVSKCTISSQLTVPLMEIKQLPETPVNSMFMQQTPEGISM
jgi:hypothetical protein